MKSTMMDFPLTLAHVSTAMFVLGGAGIALGVVGLVVSDFGGEESALLLGPTSATLRLRF